jgi:hypothetical protein
MKFCTGEDDHMVVTEILAKAWHDDDLYEMRCKKCGKTQRQLSRRPHQTTMRCGE